MLPPGVECIRFDAQGEMAWPLASVGWQLISLERCFGDEGQKNAACSNLKEYATASFLGDHPQAENVMIETLGCIEIVNVDGCLNDRLDLQGRTP